MLCSYGLRCWVLQYACSLVVCGTARLLSGAATMVALPLQCMSVLSFLHWCYCLLSFHHCGSVQCPLIEVPLLTDSSRIFLYASWPFLEFLFLSVCMCICLCFWDDNQRNISFLFITLCLIPMRQGFSLNLASPSHHPLSTCCNKMVSEGILGQPAFLCGCWGFELMSPCLYCS